jgi:hypothetical protein
MNRSQTARVRQRYAGHANEAQSSAIASSGRNGDTFEGLSLHSSFSAANSLGLVRLPALTGFRGRLMLAKEKEVEFILLDRTGQDREIVTTTVGVHFQNRSAVATWPR